MEIYISGGERIGIGGWSDAGSGRNGLCRYNYKGYGMKRKRFFQNLILKGVVFLTFILATLLMMTSPLWAEDIWTLTFESAGGYVPSITEFTDGTYDYWGKIRDDAGDIDVYNVNHSYVGETSGLAFNSIQGEYFFGGMDVDGEGATLPVNITINNIDINEYTGLTFYVFIAEDDATDAAEDWDDEDYMRINYRIDSDDGPWTNLIWVESSGYPDTTNTAPKIDTDFDGWGDGITITATFFEFNQSIAGTGTDIDIQVIFYFNDGDTDIAIDSLKITGTPGGPSGDGTGTADITFPDPPEYNVDDANKTVAVKITGTPGVTLESISIDIPYQMTWTGSSGDVALTGTGFTDPEPDASHGVAGSGTSGSPYVITVTGAAVTNTATGTVTIANLDMDGGSAGDDAANESFEFTVKTAINEGTRLPIASSPSLTVKCQAGDVVINEVMWMGSTASALDEWIELKNRTNSRISLADWKIDNAESNYGTLGIGSYEISTDDLYFLISNYNKDDSKLNVTPDIVHPSISLRDTSGNDHLILKDGSDNIIDTAKGDTWPVGDPDNKYSMERNDPPGNGILAPNWHTARGTVPDHWDDGATEKGSPKAINSLPTLVGLADFKAIAYESVVWLWWKTEMELNNAGFNIYRSESRGGPYGRLNSSLIPGLGSSIVGKEYSFRDGEVTSGTTYYYMLEDVEFDGTSTMHGPVEAHPGLDSDNDGITDDWENYYGLDPYDPADAMLDPDGDGLTNLEEFNQETDPTDPDTPTVTNTPTMSPMSTPTGTPTVANTPTVMNTPTPGGEGDDDGVKIIQSDDYGVVLELITSSFEVETKSVEYETYQVIKLPYPHGQTTELGKPQLPVKGVLLGIPFDSSITVNEVGYEEEILSGYNIHPVPRIYLEKELPEDGFLENLKSPGQLTYEFVKDADAYSQDSFYPDCLARVSPAGSLRRQDVAKLKIHPIRFNPVTGELRFYKRIRLEVDFGKKAEVDPENIDKLPASFEKLYNAMFQNYGSVKRWRRRRRGYSGPPRFVHGTAYKISVNEEGIYRLTWQDLYDASMNPYRLNPRKIDIYYRGNRIPIYVAGEEDGRFDYDDYIEFYAEAIDSRYASTNIYWLMTGNRRGLRMSEINLSIRREGQTPAAFLSNLHQEEDNMYWANIHDRGYVDDHYFISALRNPSCEWAPSLTDFSISLSDVADVEEEATITICLQGISHSPLDPDHHTLIHLNDYPIDDTSWDGNVEYTRQLNVPQSYLVEGENIITVELPGDTGAEFDLVLASWFEISYWRQFRAEGDVLKFNNQGQGIYSYTISDFTENDIEIFDITDTQNVKRIVRFDIEEDGDTYAVSFKDLVKKEGNKNYIVSSSSGAKSPTDIVKDTPSNLWSEENKADYIIITHEAFYEAVLPLAIYRAAKGLWVKVVKVQDIYDEFNYGISSPEAIKAFLTYAYTEWTEPAPTYVLLVGDGTYDYQDNEGLGFKNYMPAYLVHSLDFGEAGCDNWFVCLEGDDDILPDMFIGRLPVYTVAQANTIVDKIVNYEATLSGDWTKEVTLVADNLEQVFTDLSEALAEYIPSEEYQTNEIYLDNYGSDAAACKTDIIEAVNLGTLILNYVGHGSPFLWAHESILTLGDIPSLTNSDMLTFMSTMTCANGFFMSPGIDSMAEELLFSSAGGAVAILAPTGISCPNIQQSLNRGIFESIFVNDNFLIGPATTHGKLKVFEYAGESGKNVIQTFLLFGDPALSLIPTPEAGDLPRSTPDSLPPESHF